MPTITDLPILQVLSEDEGEEDDEKEGNSKGSREHKSSGLSSSSGSGDSDDGGGDDDDDDENVEVEDSHNPCIVDSVELGLEGGLGKEDQEVESCTEDAGAMLRRRRVHIMHEGRDVPTDEDEDEGFVRK